MKEYKTLKRLKKGNTKLHNILIFDLPAIKTCLNCGDCKKTCYAMKAQKMYPNVRNWRSDNLDISQTLSFINIISDQLRKAKQTTVRIHSSGDFYSQQYIDKWAIIVRMFPDINFYAYTKVSDLFNFAPLTNLNNFNLINSFVDGNLNYGKIDYITSLNNKIKDSFICPATTKKGVKCGLDCNYCIKGNKPLFVIH